MICRCWQLPGWVWRSAPSHWSSNRPSRRSRRWGWMACCTCWACATATVSCNWQNAVENVGGGLPPIAMSQSPDEVTETQLSGGKPPPTLGLVSGFRSGDALAHLYRRACHQFFGPLNLVRPEQHNCSRTQLEAAQFCAFLQVNRCACSLVVAEGFQLAFWRCHQPGPDGINRRDDHRTHQHHRHRAAFGVEQADNTFVTGKQLRHVFGGGLVDRENSTWHVDHLAKRTGQRHMHAVVVLGRQVNSGEIAAHKRCSQCGIAAQQFQHAEAVALGLEHAAVFDWAKLADGAVGRAEYRAWG